jgi:hypothetical protein
MLEKQIPSGNDRQKDKGFVYTHCEAATIAAMRDVDRPAGHGRYGFGIGILTFGVVAEVAGVNRCSFRQGAEVVGSTIAKGADTELRVGADQRALGRPVADDARAVDDPFHICCFFRQVNHDGFIVSVLSVEAARDGMPDGPENWRQMALIGPAQPPGLIEEAFDSMSTHRGNEPLHKAPVDGGVLLLHAVAEHGDDEIGSTYEFIEVDVFRNGALPLLEVRMFQRQFCGVAHESPDRVPRIEGQGDEVFSCSTRSTEDQER